MTSSNAGFLADRIDPLHPVFYLQQGGIPKKIQIRRIEDHTLIVDTHLDLLALKTVKGFVVAKDQMGILTFAGVVETAKKEIARVDVIGLCYDPKTVTLVNKRDSFRLPMDRPVACVLSNDHNEFNCRLTNLSAGGFCVQSTTPLIMDQLHLFSSNIKVDGTSSLDIASYPVHDFDCEETKAKCYGCRFITNQRMTSLPALNNSLEGQIVQYVNRSLLERRKREQAIKR